MKPSIRTLGEILYSPSQYVIPVFQRNYRWERPQWQQFWDSLVEIQAEDKHGNHFMGFLVFVPGVAQPGQHTTFHLIDGQQRLATSSLVLAALRNVSRKTGQQELADEIEQYYLTHPLKKGEQHYRLLPKEHDHDTYISIVTGVGQATGRMADGQMITVLKRLSLSSRCTSVAIRGKCLRLWNARESLGSNAEAIHAEWVHRPGNLTLSGYNPELWNHPFNKKRERYAQSNIVLTRELASYDRWTDQEIRSRGRDLAKQAVLIWKGPKEQVVRVEPDASDDDEGVGRQELRRHFWSGLNDYLVAEHPDLPDFDARPNWTIRLPSGLRHIGFELRFSLRHDEAGIDVWFWRSASIPVWEAINKNPDAWNALVGAVWEFEQVEGRTRARMFLNQSLRDTRDETTWPDVYFWFGEKLSLLYEKVAPKLREEMDRHEGMTSGA